MRPSASSAGNPDNWRDLNTERADALRPCAIRLGGFGRTGRSGLGGGVTFTLRGVAPLVPQSYPKVVPTIALLGSLPGLSRGLNPGVFWASLTSQPFGQIVQHRPRPDLVPVAGNPRRTFHGPRPSQFSWRVPPAVSACKRRCSVVLA